MRFLTGMQRRKIGRRHADLVPDAMNLDHGAGCLHRLDAPG